MVKRLLVAAACVVVVGSGAAQFDFFASKHEVGECVRTLHTLGGTDIETTECLAPGSSFTTAEPVYRITHVLDYDANCPIDSAYGMELKHEPDDAVYCLAIEIWKREPGSPSAGTMRARGSPPSRRVPPNGRGLRPCWVVLAVRVGLIGLPSRWCCNGALESD